MIVVLDTSVLFAAFISRSGLCAAVVEHAIETDSVCLSQFILDELQRTLLAKSKLSAPTVVEVIDFLTSEARLVAPAAISPTACRDPSDAAILGTAVAAGAEVLVSGDKDLLVLERFDSIQILTPRQYHDRITGVS